MENNNLESVTPKVKKGKRILLLSAICLIIGIAIGAFAIGSLNQAEHTNTTTKIGFEDIGELATQSAVCREVHVTDDWRKVFGGIKVPFTQSKYIFSRDYEVKAGINFEEIDWTKNEETKTISVTVPQTTILSNTPVADSFKVYHEAESIFNNVDLEESNEALDGMQKQAEKEAIENGLLEKAQDNAKVILKAFFGKSFDLNEYTIVFESK